MKSKWWTCKHGDAVSTGKKHTWGTDGSFKPLVTDGGNQEHQRALMASFKQSKINSFWLVSYLDFSQFFFYFFLFLIIKTIMKNQEPFYWFTVLSIIPSELSEVQQEGTKPHSIKNTCIHRECFHTILTLLSGFFFMSLHNLPILSVFTLCHFLFSVQNFCWGNVSVDNYALKQNPGANSMPVFTQKDAHSPQKDHNFPWQINLPFLPYPSKVSLMYF